MPPKQLKGAPPVKQEVTLKVFGNYFVPEMRTVCALLELNEIPYQCETINIFSKEGREEYQGFNPSQMMPTLIEGYQTILADPPHMYKYICKTKDVDEKFYPQKDMNRDKKKLVDQYLEYIQWMVKRNSDRLTKLKIESILLERGLIEKEEVKFNDGEEAKEKDIFFNIIVPNLESHLDGGKTYLCGYDFSIADIAFFNELINVIEIIEQNIDAKRFPNIDKWMKRIEDIGPIRVGTIKFQDELKKLQERFRA
ncbi:glutathione s-transferase [Stylonychia lemnae]|uniref:Glutathione s-transferase n=1 Tax=Stylonychia lemnae TaxID=5949 RepID=A0A078APD3_STYLE|nr:glutathione s-transferase [Stylonychia lemnae]|eukprot:CDW83806.1 glutathione s-transferase [Stylonychia lemnae]